MNILFALIGVFVGTFALVGVIHYGTKLGCKIGSHRVELGTTKCKDCGVSITQEV